MSALLWIGVITVVFTTIVVLAIIYASGAQNNTLNTGTTILNIASVANSGAPNANVRNSLGATNSNVGSGTNLPECNTPLSQLPEILMRDASGNPVREPGTNNAVPTAPFQSCYVFNSNIQDITTFYDSTNVWTVSSVNPEAAPSSEQICSQYCTNLTLPLTCNSNDARVAACLALIQPQNCDSPALPAAKNGTTQYFVLGRGKIGCNDRVPPL